MESRPRRMSIYYRGTTADGAVFDSRESGSPFDVVLGQTPLPSGLEDALHDMVVGEERTVELPPEKAFGLHDPSDVLAYPTHAIPGSEDMPVGQIITMYGRKPGMCPAHPRVVGNDGIAVPLDFNHPMAGKQVTYWVRVVG